MYERHDLRAITAATVRCMRSRRLSAESRLRYAWRCLLAVNELGARSGELAQHGTESASRKVIYPDGGRETVLSADRGMLVNAIMLWRAAGA